MNTSEILNKAADLIEERGWNQGWYCGPNGELCADGAIFAAAGIEPRPRDDAFWWIANDDGVIAAEDALRKVIRGPIARWNDSHRRTSSEVVEALREAARAER